MPRTISVIREPEKQPLGNWQSKKLHVRTILKRFVILLLTPYKQKKGLQSQTYMTTKHKHSPIKIYRNPMSDLTPEIACSNVVQKAFTYSPYVPTECEEQSPK